MRSIVRNLDTQVKEAVKAFWAKRLTAQQAQKLRGVADRGGRASVTSGKHMDGFTAIAVPIVKRANIPKVRIVTKGEALRLPGYYRHTKKFDLLVFDQDVLLAALEFKSMVGSFGNNSNNRAEEVVGAASDFWAAYERGLLGNGPRPFFGWLMLVQDHEKSRHIIKDVSEQFNIDVAFARTSYIDRFSTLCERMVADGLYTEAAVISSRRGGANHDGSYKEETEGTGIRKLFEGFAQHLTVYAMNRLIHGGPVRRTGARSRLRRRGVIGKPFVTLMQGTPIRALRPNSRGPWPAPRRSSGAW